MTILALRLGLPQLAALSGNAVSTFSPSMVSFHRDVSLKYAAGSITAAPRGVMSVWLCSQGNSSVHSAMYDNRSNGLTFGQFDPAKANAEANGWNYAMDGGFSGGLRRLNINDSTGGTNHSALATYGPPAVINKKIQHHLWAWDTNYSGTKRSSLWIDGVQVATGITDQGTWNGTLTSPSYSGGDGFFLNPFGTGQVRGDFDCAQFFFDTPSSTPLDASNNATFDITKFYNAGPVDFGSDGSLPLGHQPIIFHDGDASTFATNKGSLGNIATVVGGTNANSKKLFDAPKNPGASADRPYLLWWDHNVPGSQPTTAITESSGTYSSFTNDGQPVVAGDLLVALIKFSSGSGTARLPSITGWTLVPNSRQSLGLGDFAAFYKVVGAGDTGLLANPGSEWSTGPTMTWTTKGALISASIVFLNYRSDTGTSPAIQDSACSSSSASPASGFVCPAVTSGSALSLLVNAVAVFDWANEGTPSPPASSRIRHKRGDDAMSGPFPYVVDEKVNATGTTGTRTFGVSGATGNPNAMLSFILQ